MLRTTYSLLGQNCTLITRLNISKTCRMSSREFEITPSKEWFDDLLVYRPEQKRELKNDGFWVIQTGEAKGTILGANLCTFQPSPGYRVHAESPRFDSFWKATGNQAPSF